MNKKAIKLHPPHLAGRFHKLPTKVEYMKKKPSPTAYINCPGRIHSSSTKMT